MIKIAAAIVLLFAFAGTAVFFLVSGQRKINGPMENARIVVRKSERKLFLYDKDELVRTYNIVLGFAPNGDKSVEGDGKTPLGEFYVAVKNPNSKFTLSLGLSYPNLAAAERGLREKLITREQYDAIIKALSENKMPPQDTALGSYIYIHGGGTAKDWTEGCVALDDAQIAELFEAVPVGAKVVVIE